MRFMIKTEKPQREEVKGRYPNLSSDVSITLKIVKRSFPYSDDRRMKKQVEDELDKGLYLNNKFQINQMEKVTVYNKTGEVWSGKVSIPSWAVKKNRYFRKHDIKVRKFVEKSEEDKGRIV